MEIENALGIIKEMVKSNKIPGAFIFEDESGEAGGFCAEILAKTIVCQNTAYKKSFGEPCGVCAGCIKADKGIHPDIIAAKPDGEGSLSLHIDKVREMIDGLYFLPNEADIKVYIIRDMQNMTPQAQNALLKSIEEPPPFAVFIITVNNGDLILETVKSRAALFVLKNAGRHPKKKSPELYGEFFRDMLTNKSDKFSVYQKLFSALIEKPDKTEVFNFYCHTENALRDILMAKIFALNKTPGDSDMSGVPFLYFNGFGEINDLINLYSIKKILNLSKNIQKYKSDLDYNVNIKLNLTAFLSDLIV